jgi:hypothetical protein
MVLWPKDRKALLEARQACSGGSVPGVGGGEDVSEAKQPAIVRSRKGGILALRIVGILLLAGVAQVQMESRPIKVRFFTGRIPAVVDQGDQVGFGGNLYSSRERDQFWAARRTPTSPWS